MVNYKLGYKSNNIYHELDYNKIDNNKDKYKLSNIDRFTTKYEDEDNLKNDLIKNNILSLRLIKAKLLIYYKYNNEYKKITRSLLYKDDLIYLDNIKLVRHVLDIIDNIDIPNDIKIKYLKSLYNSYSHSNYDRYSLYTINILLNRYTYNGYLTKEEIIKLKNNIIILLNSIINKNNINYKNLHDLATCIRSLDNYLNTEYRLNKKILKKELTEQLSFY